MRKFYFNYVFERAKAELSAESSRTHASYLWWIVEPCLMAAVFYGVFGVLFERGGPGFALSLLVGVTAWLWFSASILRALASIQREQNLLQQVYVPKFVFPFSSVMVDAVKQVIVFIVIALMIAIAKGVSTAWLCLPVIWIIQLLLVAGLSTLLAAFQPFFPDLQKIIAPLMQLGLFCSGVFYSIDDLPDQYQSILNINPMVQLIESYRTVMVEGYWPEPQPLIWVALTGLILIAVSLEVIKRFDRLYPRVIL